MSHKITSVKLIPCGICENNLGIVFKGHKKEKRYFPAMTGLIIHEKLGPILYDTGYSELIFKNGIISFLYNLLNKATVKESDVIINKLPQLGIDSADIKNIILSHSHPDHIGALSFFKNINLFSTKEVFETMDNPKLFDLVFKNMLPGSDVTRVTVENKTDSFLNSYFESVYDVLGDGSIIGVVLDGHARGQLGIYIPEHNLLLASDSCWGTDLLDLVPNMRAIPRRIQNNYKKYAQTVESLKKLQKDHPEIEIIFSHQVDLHEGKYYE